MEAEEIVLGAQVIAAGLRIGVTYLAVVLLLILSWRWHLVPGQLRGVARWGGALLCAIPLTLAIEMVATLVRRLRRA